MSAVTSIADWLCVVHIGDVFITQRYKDCTINTIHYFRVSIKNNESVFKHKPFITSGSLFKTKHQAMYTFHGSRCSSTSCQVFFFSRYRCCRCSDGSDLAHQEMKWKFEDLAGNASWYVKNPFGLRKHTLTKTKDRHVGLFVGRWMLVCWLLVDVVSCCGGLWKYSVNWWWWHLFGRQPHWFWNIWMYMYRYNIYNICMNIYLSNYLKT